jgi:hypothetical protein
MPHVIPRLNGPLLIFGVGLVLLGGATSGAAQEATPTPTTLVEAVRQATAPFPDPAAAEAAGYVHMQGCVSGPQDGAMGLHYVNADLVGDGELDAAHPEILIYALQDGTLQFVGVEYLVLADAWEAKHEGPPILMGQLFNFVGAPNRYRNPPFYELHVWVGQANPHGMFADWNPTVSCADVPGA